MTRFQKFSKSIKDLKLLLYPENFVSMLGKCVNEAYMDKLVEINSMELKLKRILIEKNGIDGDKTVTIGKNPYGKLVQNWVFTNVSFPPSKFSRKMTTLFESGVVDQWMNWMNGIKTWGNTVAVAQAS